jgi:hypothetical protein
MKKKLQSLKIESKSLLLIFTGFFQSVFSSLMIHSINNNEIIIQSISSLCYFLLLSINTKIISNLNNFQITILVASTSSGFILGNLIFKLIN